MKFLRLRLRLAVLLLAAAAFAGLTWFYGGLARPLPANPGWRTERSHRPSTPGPSRFPEFVGEVMVVAIVAAVGRLAFRLGLSPASRSERKAILLDLGQERRERQTTRDPEVTAPQARVDPA